MAKTHKYSGKIRIELAGKRRKKEIEDFSAKIQAAGGYARIDTDVPKLIISLGTKNKLGQLKEWHMEGTEMQMMLDFAYSYSDVRPTDNVLWMFFKMAGTIGEFQEQLEGSAIPVAR